MILPHVLMAVAICLMVLMSIRDDKTIKRLERDLRLERAVGKHLREQINNADRNYR